MIFDGNAFSSVRFFVCRKPLFLLGCPQREKRLRGRRSLRGGLYFFLFLLK
jgi:hypothetical protein